VVSFPVLATEATTTAILAAGRPTGITPGE
jgi:hypothetical protein